MANKEVEIPSAIMFSGNAADGFLGDEAILAAFVGNTKFPRGQRQRGLEMLAKLRRESKATVDPMDVANLNPRQ